MTLGFPKGMFGVCITVLAIMGTVICGFAMAVDEQTSTSIQYDYVTDLTGLFPTTDEPQFIDYDPAANWTGYTQGQSVTSGISFQTSSSQNGYPIRQETTEISSGTLTLTPTNASDIPLEWGDRNYALISDEPTVRPTDRTEPYYYTASPNSIYGIGLISVRQMIETANWSEDWDILSVNLTSNVIAIPLSSWTTSTYLANPGGWPSRYVEIWTANYTQWVGTIDRLEINGEADILTAYDESGQTVFYGSTSELTLFFASEGTYNVLGAPDLGSTVSYSLLQQPSPIYMDPSQGVSILSSNTSTTTWDNGYEVGSMDILFQFRSSSSASTPLEAHARITLTDVDGNPISGSATVGGRYYTGPWVMSLNSVYSSTTRYISLGYGIMDSSGSSHIMESISISIPSGWTAAMLSLDTWNGKFSLEFVTSMASLDDYTLSGRSQSYDFDTWGPGSCCIGSIGWSAPNSQYSTPSMGVVGTSVFMNTYGVVLTDPSLDVSSYFPDLDDYRINFYSFALVGDSLTINGQTFEVNQADQTITIDDVSHTLTNYYITFEDGHTYITFNNEWNPQPIDLGTTTSNVLSFSGIWYFSTGLWEGQEVTTESYVWSWDEFIFDQPAAILTFLGILILGTVVGLRVGKLSALDYVILFCAALFGYVMMGM